MGLFFDDPNDMYDYFPGEFVHGDDVALSDDYLGEKWWYIDGAPGYMVSDHGRVWSKKHQKFRKLKKMDKHGHLGLCLSIDGKPRDVYIHRLMGEAFIPNTFNDPLVRHLNDIPYDNGIENLAWGTQRENWEDSFHNGNAHFVTPEEREIGLTKMRKPIIATNIKTGEICEFIGQTEASRILGIQQSNIWKVLNGRRTHAGGWYFEYLDKEEYSDGDY